MKSEHWTPCHVKTFVYMENGKWKQTKTKHQEMVLRIAWCFSAYDSWLLLLEPWEFRQRNIMEFFMQKKREFGKTSGAVITDTRCCCCRLKCTVEMIKGITAELCEMQNVSKQAIAIKFSRFILSTMGQWNPCCEYGFHSKWNSQK